ncbi:MAG: hypothetical protein HOJ50_04985 [Proteobacteria bacterium]|nr:hypothetical protein [Pseudomonadota bacterium]
MPESLTPVAPQSDGEESSEDESEEASAEDINPETSDDDEPLVGGEYPGEGSHSEGTEIQDPDERSATKAALTSEFD